MNILISFSRRIPHRPQDTSLNNKEGCVNNNVTGKAYDLEYSCLNIYIHFDFRISLRRKFMSRGLPPDKFRLRFISNLKCSGYGLKFKSRLGLRFGGYDIQ